MSTETTETTTIEITIRTATLAALEAAATACDLTVEELLVSLGEGYVDEEF
jgi:hypothetical protein